MKKEENLVYIHINSKLLQERRGADPVIWYNNKLFSEDSDSDVEPLDTEDDSINGGDDGSIDGDGKTHNGSDNFDEDIVNDLARKLPSGKAGNGLFN